MEKKFFDVFKKYNPSQEKRELLERAYSAKFRYTKNPMRIEVELFFDGREDFTLIYEIEDECRELYEAESFKILPHFPPSSFDVSNFDEIITEASIYGAITHGFLSSATFVDNGESIEVTIPYSDSGVDFVNLANTEAILENILASRYGIRRKVFIKSGGDLEAYEREWEIKREQLLREAEARNREEYAREREQAARDMEEQARANDPHYDFERLKGLSKLTGNFKKINDTTFLVGTTTYNTEGAEIIFGDELDLTTPTPIADIEGVRGNATFFGTVFSVESKETRTGDNINVIIGISDGASGTYARAILKPEKAEWVKGFKAGAHVAVFGRVIRDKYDNEPYISFRAVSKIKIKERMDDAKEKRVELHLHSNMSQMDALITPAEIVKTAIRWGHKAIAVTDHGNVQAFPEVMLALEGAREKGAELKVLYGIEAYYVNDTAKCMFGSKYPAFDDEMVVFDIETTGLSNRTCKIIEIGAVKIKDGKVIDSMDIFVDPECPIPEQITTLTSITDEMVVGAPKEREAVEKFLEFAGDRMLIAHNAAFDVGFIRAAAARHGLPFENTYLDTVGLSRYVNPELGNHKLDTIAKHYKLDDFHHHRAEDDARILAEIFFVMQARLREEGVATFDEMNERMSEHTDPKKLKAYHMIIFAKTREGLRNLYKLISYSYLNYYGGFGRQKKVPRIPRSVLEEHREGLIIGSACEAGELFSAIKEGKTSQEIDEIASFYDYLEIQPLCNNRFLVRDGEVRDEQTLIDFNRQIYELGKRLGKPVCATCDAHFLNKEDEVYRRVLTANMFKDADQQADLYLRTTDEMLAEFEYLGEEAAREVVIVNPNKIADMIDDIRPIPKGRYDPIMPGANEELTESCWRRAREWYGEDVPEIVSKRLTKELDSIIKNNFAGLYMISVKLVAYSESLGYLVGSRGSVGSSLVATMSGISEVNPLPPHYRCPKCKYSEFHTEVGSGFDLPDKACPVCGEPLYPDGHDIPFETFLGFKGDKSPDIDLNFSGDVQGRVHKYTEELFGEGHVFRAGTIGTLADKTAWGYISKYLEERKLKIPKAQMWAMVSKMVGVKRTTGQHPGGIIVVPKEYEIYDFTPVQHPADDPNSDIITTHFQFSYLHDTILKLDELGHDMPTKYKMLEKYTNTSVLDVKMNDKSVYELFESTKPLGIEPKDIGGCLLGTYGIPEMGTRFIQQVLLDAQPKTFADLLQISGLTHGTDVWLGNAQELIKQGTCTISEVVGTRDGIMLYLISKGLDDSDAFKIMESVRKGKGLTPAWEELMTSHGVPDWYIWSCKKIKYMFPKAHAAAYDMSAIRLGWYKIYYPMEFYAAFFTVAPAGFDAEIVGGGLSKVNLTIKELEDRESKQEATQKDKELLATLFLVREAMARGVKFLGVDLMKSDAFAFLPENGKIRMPFNSLAGLGDGAAEKIIRAREDGEIYSIEDLRERSGISKTVIEILRRNNVLDGLSETNQYTLF